jgi:hypothetical protein
MGEAICKANAAEMARLSHAARKAKMAALIERANGVSQAEQDANEFKLSRLSRVRLQLLMIDNAIEKELKKSCSLDAGKLDRLASAAIRLNEQERQLSNRSLPPTLKANSVPARKRSSGSAPEPTFEG